MFTNNLKSKHLLKNISSQEYENIIIRYKLYVSILLIFECATKNKINFIEYSLLVLYKYSSFYDFWFAFRYDL